MTIHFARSTLSLPPLSPGRLPEHYQQQLQQQPLHRRPRYQASRILLAEMMQYFYGYKKLPEIHIDRNGRPMFINDKLPKFSISYAGNLVGITLCDSGYCGFSMTLLHKTRFFHEAAETHTANLSRNEATWVKNQTNPAEACSQLMVLRASIAKFFGCRQFGAKAIQLIPGAGRIKTEPDIALKALSCVEDIVAWAVAANPEAGPLNVWELSEQLQWNKLTAPNTDYTSIGPIMRFTSMSYERSLME